MREEPDADRKVPRRFYSDDRHILFCGKSDEPLTLLAKRSVAIPFPEHKFGKAKSSQAIVVLCSGGCSVTPEAPEVASEIGTATEDERWCSWADVQPTAREKLVEEQLERTHREYSRLFQQHGCLPKPADGVKTITCRACFDPSPDHLLSAIGTTRRMTPSNGRAILHYMHHRPPSSPAMRDEGGLLVRCPDTSLEKSLHLQHVHEQLRSPALYIFDCPHAGRLTHALNDMVPASDDVVALGTCGQMELLPWEQLGLPSDLFTACLMSPLRAALNFYRWRSNRMVSEKPLSALGLVVGRMQDRNSPLGELTAIFTAITDAIAWNSLPTKLFLRLFREDGTVAQLCRNFLLAARILHSYGLSATSRPSLPSMHDHRLWDTWDTTLELFLVRLSQSQSPSVQSAVKMGPCEFFEEQMAAFAVWLRFFQSPDPSMDVEQVIAPAELPVMLQALLHPSCRCRVQALHLLASFVDLGSWAAQLTMLMGIRPYLSKLLALDDSGVEQLEVAGLAVTVWTKILVADGGQEGLPGKDTYKVFMRVALSQSLSDYHRGLAYACLAVACKGRPAIQQGLFASRVLDLVVDVLSGKSRQPQRIFRWMAALLCAEVCNGCENIAAAALDGGTAEALVQSLGDVSPEVRASAVYAIGCILTALPQAQSESDAKHEGRRLWLARITMWSFCRQLDGSAKPLLAGQLPTSHGVALDSAFLNEASALVRHELLCTLDTSGSVPARVPRVSTLGTVSSQGRLAPLPTCRDESSTSEQGDEDGSSSHSSSCATTPTLGPARAPFLRPNSSIGAMSVAAAHQQELRFMDLLLPGSATRRSRHGSTQLPQAARSATGLALGSLRKVVSESNLSRLRMGFSSDVEGDDEPVSASESVSKPESAVFPWTVNYLQQANSLSELEMSCQGESRVVLRLCEAGPPPVPLRDGSEASANAEPGRPQCFWGQHNVDDKPGYINYDSTCGCCTPVSLPSRPAPPFVTFGPTKRRGSSSLFGSGQGVGQGGKEEGLRPWRRAASSSLFGQEQPSSFSDRLLSSGQDAQSMAPHTPTNPLAPSPGPRPLRTRCYLPAPDQSVLAKDTSWEKANTQASGTVSSSFSPRTVTSRALQAMGQEPMVDVSLGSACASHIGGGWSPTAMPMPALWLHPSMSRCIVRETSGSLTIVDYSMPSRPVVRALEPRDSPQDSQAQPGARWSQASSFGLPGSVLRQSTLPALPHSKSSGSMRGTLPRPAVTQVALIDTTGGQASDDVDPHSCVLCCGSDDGSVQICKCWGCRHHEPAIISNFQALARRPSASPCISWMQTLGRLVVAGRDAQIRIWDLDREQLLSSFKHNNMHCVTALAQCLGSKYVPCCAGTDGLVFAGCGDGSTLALDPRIPKGLVHRHDGLSAMPVVGISPCLRSSSESRSTTMVAATDLHGNVDLWDLRAKMSKGSRRLEGRQSVAGQDHPLAMSQALPGCSYLACAWPSLGDEGAHVTIEDLLTSEHCAILPLRPSLQPRALSFSPSPCMLGVLAQDDTDAGPEGAACAEDYRALDRRCNRLLLFSSAQRRE
eukprot:TRINITY_DN27254_c0_g1_i1.p1 TRINITY_DN27254_c0_g1~~TRINITY_DN27254_c0_g1_i1.p1  ORF type:complete len:1546 (-),score=201.99 TRINITY_DN27254_c0_g1_i1:159-4796(-)